MDKNELREHVKNRDEIGVAYAEMQLGFIKWLAKKGKILD